MIAWYTCENALLIVFTYKLRHVQDDFNISRELKVVLATWLISSTLDISFSLSQERDLLRCTTFVILVRNLVCLWFSSAQPLIQTYSVNTLVPFPPDIECIRTTEMVLNVPVAASFFYEFLRRKKDKRGLHAFDLYSDLRIYESLFRGENVP